jgi:Fic-DOC domain mobile mystery protein B
MEVNAFTDSGDGNTPLNEDEAEGLIPPHISNRSELNGWEAENIKEAMEWAEARSPDMLDAKALRALHMRMFGKTWQWAGNYRTSGNNISSYTWPEIPRLVNDLLENTRTQYENVKDSLAGLDALAARYHHQLVLIHPWPNGNGRHARLATDLLLRRWGRPQFTWGSASSHSNAAQLRKDYLKALRAADDGSYDELNQFVRS